MIKVKCDELEVTVSSRDGRFGLEIGKRLT